jgi:hypothetical protein
MQTIRARASRAVVVAAACASLFAGGAVVLPGIAHAASTTALKSGATLASGDSVKSPNGAYKLVMRLDGNLAVVNSSGHDVFFTHTGSYDGAHAVMRSSGNLAVVTKGGTTVWQSYTGDYSGAHLVLKDDGHIAVVTTTAATVWNTAWLQTASGAQAFAKARFKHYGWSVATQYTYLDKVWGGIESSWQWNVCYGGSHYPSCNYQNTAYGIPQSDPGSKMAATNPDWATNGLTQVVWGLDYIHAVYSTPKGAYDHEENSCSRPPCGY